MPSASLPKGEPNGAPGTTALNLNLAAVAGKERQNVGRLNTHHFGDKIEGQRVFWSNSSRSKESNLKIKIMKFARMKKGSQPNFA